MSDFLLHRPKYISGKALPMLGLLAQCFTRCLGSPRRDLDLNGEAQAVMCLLLYFLEPNVRPLRLLTNNVFH